VLKFLFALVFCFSAFAEVKGFVGVDLFQPIAKNNRHFHYNNSDTFTEPHKQLTRIAVGLTYKPIEDKHLYFAVRTNKLANGYMERTVYDTLAKQDVKLLQKLTSDSFIVATAVHKYALPFFVISRTTAESHLIYKSGASAKDKISTTLFGLGVSIPIKEKHSFSLTFFLPNKDFNNNGSIGLSYSFYVF
jgi:hypothetical protein